MFRDSPSYFDYLVPEPQRRVPVYLDVPFKPKTRRAVSIGHP
jgi:hypothetical protein